MGLPSRKKERFIWPGAANSTWLLELPLPFKANMSSHALYNCRCCGHCKKNQQLLTIYLRISPNPSFSLNFERWTPLKCQMLFMQDIGRILIPNALTAKVLLKNGPKVASSTSVICLFWVSFFLICDWAMWMQKASVTIIIQGSMF